MWILRTITFVSEVQRNAPMTMIPVFSDEGLVTARAPAFACSAQRNRAHMHGSSMFVDGVF